MPYNKGDFTQQGVAGHVNANLRLNEKRLVSIDLTSNEEAEGCTIAGTVTDLLNDKVYSIGSAPSGNIEITENGENINVAPYATATVNVSGGGVDLLHTTVKIVNKRDSAYEPGIVIMGYTVKLSELLASGADLLYSTSTNGVNGLAFSDLSVEIPRGETLTFDAYYSMNSLVDEYHAGVLFGPIDATAVNMTYDNQSGVWEVTDTTQNSELSWEVEK